MSWWNWHRHAFSYHFSWATISLRIKEIRLLNYHFHYGKHAHNCNFANFKSNRTIYGIIRDSQRFPFNWQNPWGFLIALGLQYAMHSYGMLIGACALILGAAAFLYAIAASKCIKANLFSIAQCTRNKTNQNILDRFIEFIQFHSCVTQLSLKSQSTFYHVGFNWPVQCFCRSIGNFSDIYQRVFAIVFMWSMVTICSALLVLQLLLVQSRYDLFSFPVQPFNRIQSHFFIQLHHSDGSKVLSITIFQVIYPFAVLLITCELCQQMNFAFDECNDMIVQFEWYLFPADVQRMLPLIINFTQQPVEINCFGSTAADRETFKYVWSICRGEHHHFQFCARLALNTWKFINSSS